MLSRTSRTRGSSTVVVYAALASDILVAITKIIAAIWTGSAAMASEAIHSIVDTGNEILLLYGMHRSRQRPDWTHPLGYGRELYFWSFIVALLVFALGAGFSLFEGVQHVLKPRPIQAPIVSYVVLGLAFILEGSSWAVSLRQFTTAKGEFSYYEAFRRSKNPPSFMTSFEDSAALLGIAVAGLGTLGSIALRLPELDGVASILIGLILAGTAALLARESKSLLIGEQAQPALRRSILDIANREPHISRAHGLMTFQLAPEQVVGAISLAFDKQARSTQIEDQIVVLERKVQAAHPQIVMLFVKPQSLETFQRWRKSYFGSSEPHSLDDA
ncbi:MAG: putative Cation-efflux pump [Bradyrhizobium sp.]|nr:putative Cation-efflux pump [Bradyrhizobium sp.]